MDWYWYATYCFDEFGTPIVESIDSFMNAKDGLSTLDVLYSTYDDDDGEHDLQVEADLVRGLTIISKDNEVVYRKPTTGEFEEADFQSIYDWAVEICREV